MDVYLAALGPTNTRPDCCIGQPQVSLRLALLQIFRVCLGWSKQSGSQQLSASNLGFGLRDEQEPLKSPNSKPELSNSSSRKTTSQGTQAAQADCSERSRNSKRGDPAIPEAKPNPSPTKQKKHTPTHTQRHGHRRLSSDSSSSPVSVGPGGDACDLLEKPSPLKEPDGPRGRMTPAEENHLLRLPVGGHGPQRLLHQLRKVARDAVPEPRG